MHLGVLWYLYLVFFVTSIPTQCNYTPVTLNKGIMICKHIIQYIQIHTHTLFVQPKKNDYIVSIENNTCVLIKELGVKRTFRG